jgi:superfamily I DNA/RNA helicase
MVNPHTSSLLVLYDDAQSIYDTRKKGTFSFKGVGIQAQGRTTILKVNYRNTHEILDFAADFARQLLTQEEADEDGIPRLAPVSAGRRGTRPLLIKLPTIQAEADEIANRLKEAHQSGVAWKDMAVLYWDAKDRYEIYRALKSQHIYVVGKDTITFDKEDTKVKFLTIHNSKGLEFPLVAIMGGRIVEQAKSDVEAAKLLYVAMTRATSQLVLTVAGPS